MYKTHSEELVKEYISKLKPLKYNQFRWWRKWDVKKDPLHKYQPLINKIQNGDYDFSHYFWQAQHCEIEMNKIQETCIDTQHWVELTQMDRARRKRLWEDFEKDEAEKLKVIEKEFVLTFRMTKEDYYSELENFDGTLEEYYYHCKSVFGTYNQLAALPKRGRPAKI